MRASSKKHWDNFWDRKKDVDEVYSNADRLIENLCSVENVKGKKALEIGGGTGRDSIELAKLEADLFIIDYSQQSLDIIKDLRLREKLNLFLVKANALSLPFKEGIFDIVFHQGLLEHFRKPEYILKENHRVLKTDGIILVDVPNRYHPYTVVKHILILIDKWFAGWETEYSVNELINMLREQGFKVIKYYGDWMNPSFFYRLLREILLHVNVKLPLYPKGFKITRNIRNTARKQLAKYKISQYSFCNIGAIARK